ncbi:fungal-specific transcription factor domain-containing protein [Umbelopsis sp. PMI_123]|nr:fungal-specific transcription factor domain-containing protein [Umbelopsis sp. PMI_123]
MFATLNLPLKDDSRHRRLKVTEACRSCRVKKIKCDGLRPCWQCKARRRNCTYSKYLDELVPKNGLATESSNMTDNESLAPSRPQSPFQILPEAEQQVTITDSSTNNNTPSRPIQDANRLSENMVENLQSRIGGLSINQGKTHPLLSTNDMLWEFKPYLFEPSLPDSYSGVLDMPTRTIQEHLMDIYFRRHYQIMPIFSRKVFTQHLSEKGYLVSPLALNAMYAHACTYEPDLQDHADVFFDRARSLVEDFLDVPRIGSIFSLLLMATYESRPIDGKGGRRSCRSSIYAGMAISMCLEMKLQKDTYLRKMTKFDVELRNRIFWTCYNMDKLTSLGTQRPYMISQKDTLVSIPKAFPEDEDSIPIEAFACQTRLMILCEKYLDLHSSMMHHSTYLKDQEGWSELLKELSDWLTSLPTPLSWTPMPEVSSPIPIKPPQSAAIAMLHLQYNVIEHRVLSINSQKSVKSVHRRIRTVGNTITQLAHFLVNDTNLLTNYDFCAHSVLLAALTHANDLQHSTPQVLMQSEVQLRRSIAIIGYLLDTRTVTGSGSFSALIDTMNDSLDSADSRTLSSLQLHDKAKALLERLGTDPSGHQRQGMDPLSFSKQTVFQQMAETDFRHTDSTEHISNLPPILQSDQHHSQPRLVHKYSDHALPESSKVLEPAHYTFELISVDDDNWGYGPQIATTSRTLDHQQPDSISGINQAHLTVHSSPSNSIHEHSIIKNSRHITPPPAVARHYSPSDMDTPPPDPRTLWNHTSSTLDHSPSSDDTILYSIAASATGWVDDSEKWYSGHHSQAPQVMVRPLEQQALSTPTTIALDIGVSPSSKFILHGNNIPSTTASIAVPSTSAHHLLPDQHSHALIDHMHIDSFD